MERVETSQIRIEADERMRGAIESGPFSSALGANHGAATMRIDAFEHPGRKLPDRAPLARAPAPSKEYSPFESAILLRFPVLPP